MLRSLEAYCEPGAPRTLKNVYEGNLKMPQEDIAAVARLMDEHPIRGDRAFGMQIDLK